MTPNQIDEVVAWAEQVWPSERWNDSLRMSIGDRLKAVECDTHNARIAMNALRHDERVSLHASGGLERLTSRLRAVGSQVAPGGEEVAPPADLTYADSIRLKWSDYPGHPVITEDLTDLQVLTAHFAYQFAKQSRRAFWSESIRRPGLEGDACGRERWTQHAYESLLSAGMEQPSVAAFLERFVHLSERESREAWPQLHDVFDSVEGSGAVCG